MTDDGGDGTVPIASSMVQAIRRSFSRKDHVRIFEDRDVREALFVFLDAPLGVRPQAAEEGEAVGELDRIGLSVTRRCTRSTSRSSSWSATPTRSTIRSSRSPSSSSRSRPRRR